MVDLSKIAYLFVVRFAFIGPAIALKVTSSVLIKELAYVVPLPNLIITLGNLVKLESKYENVPEELIVTGEVVTTPVDVTV